MIGPDPRPGDRERLEDEPLREDDVTRADRLDDRVSEAEDWPDADEVGAGE